MKKMLLLFALGVVAFSYSLKLEIKNTTVGGEFYVAVYDSKESFLDESRAIRKKITKESMVEFRGLKGGEYGVTIFQDLNNNEKLDENFLGMPQEPYGFSKNYKPSLSSVKFDDISFPLVGDVSSSIELIK